MVWSHDNVLKVWCGHMTMSWKYGVVTRCVESMVWSHDTELEVWCGHMTMSWKYGVVV